MTDDNVIEGPWDQPGDEITDEEYSAAMDEITSERLGELIGTVLEMLTMYAVDYGPYYITADENKAVTIIAVEDDVEEVLNLLPKKFKSWETIQDQNAEEFVSNADPGDEQNEPTS